MKGVGTFLAILALGGGFPAVGQNSPRSAPEIVIEPVRGIYGHLTDGPFLEPAGIYWDRWEDELFIVDPGGRRIAITDERGFPTFSFGSARTLSSPRSVVTDRAGRIFVADRNLTAIRVFDYDGTLLPDLDLGDPPDGGEPLRPVALAVSDDERVWVVDGANRRVLSVAADGSDLRAFGAPPGRTDLLVAPVDLEVAPGGEVVVSDAAGLPVQVYDLEGSFLRGWGSHDVGLSGFSLPSGVTVDDAGRIWIADTLRQDVKVFRSDGEFVTNFGGVGTGPGQLLYPVDVECDRRGRVFVLERLGRRAQIFHVRDRGGSFAPSGAGAAQR